MVEVVRAGQILVPGLNLLHKKRALDSLPLTTFCSLMLQRANLNMNRRVKNILFGNKKAKRRF
jgi:hypothetical protein